MTASPSASEDFVVPFSVVASLGWMTSRSSLLRVFWTNLMEQKSGKYYDSILDSFVVHIRMTIWTSVKLLHPVSIIVGWSWTSWVTILITVI